MQKEYENLKDSTKEEQPSAETSQSTTESSFFLWFKKKNLK